MNGGLLFLICFVGFILIVFGLLDLNSKGHFEKFFKKKKNEKRNARFKNN